MSIHLKQKRNTVHKSYRVKTLPDSYSSNLLPNNTDRTVAILSNS